jgi:hypothetical protein
MYLKMPMHLMNQQILKNLKFHLLPNYQNLHSNLRYR